MLSRPSILPIFCTLLVLLFVIDAVESQRRRKPRRTPPKCIDCREGDIRRTPKGRTTTRKPLRTGGPRSVDCLLRSGLQENRLRLCRSQNGSVRKKSRCRNGTSEKGRLRKSRVKRVRTRNRGLQINKVKHFRTQSRVSQKSRNRKVRTQYDLIQRNYGNKVRIRTSIPQKRGMNNALSRTPIRTRIGGSQKSRIEKRHVNNAFQRTRIDHVATVRTRNGLIQKSPVKKSNSRQGGSRISHISVKQACRRIINFDDKCKKRTTSRRISTSRRRNTLRRNLESMGNTGSNNLETRYEFAINIARLWSGGILPYLIEIKDFHARRAIYKAIQQFHKYTCIQMVKRTFEQDYIVYHDSSKFDGCSSEVGRVGGRQLVSLYDGCHNTGTVVHETMHALGFEHEHARPDRDYYINVTLENLDTSEYGEEDTRSQFNIVDESMLVHTNLAIGYDYFSVMQYSEEHFAKSEMLTMQPKVDPEAPLGQLSGLSARDVMKINKLYNCPKSHNPQPDCRQTTGRDVPSCKIWAKFDLCKPSVFQSHVVNNCPLTCKTGCSSRYADKASNLGEEDFSDDEYGCPNQDPFMPPERIKSGMRRRRTYDYDDRYCQNHRWWCAEQLDKQPETCRERCQKPRIKRLCKRSCGGCNVPANY